MSTSTDWKNEYIKNFDAEWYLDTYYGSVTGSAEEGNFLEFALDEIHNIFTSGIVSGSILLDIGTGPTIHSVISASSHVKDIYLSDYSERNTSVLKKWWKGDFTYEQEIFKYILDKENKGESVENRNSEMKKKVKNVIGVDVSLQKPLLSDDDIPATFDIIISSLCLEAASLTKEEYTQSVEHIKPLINTGGSLILVGVLNETFYKVGNVDFPCLKISKDELQNIYKEQGFNIKYWTDLDMHSGIVSGSILLDIGTGPTIHSVISASSHVKDIYLSDYSERNTSVLKKWWKGDFTYEQEIFKYILDKDNKGKSVETRNSEMKKKLKYVIRVDVSLPKPLLSDDEIPETFDIIISSLCLEAASLTKEDYIQSVENIKPLINTDGSLILVGVLNQTFYKVGNVDFPCIKICKDELQDIYKEQGFNIKYWTDLDMHSDKYKQHDDFTGAFVMAAQKL